MGRTDGRGRRRGRHGDPAGADRTAAGRGGGDVRVGQAVTVAGSGVQGAGQLVDEMRRPASRCTASVLRLRDATTR